MEIDEPLFQGKRKYNWGCLLYTADWRTGNEEIKQPIDNDKIQFYQRKKMKQINKIRVFGCRDPGHLVYVGTIMTFWSADIT